MDKKKKLEPSGRALQIKRFLPTLLIAVSLILLAASWITAYGESADVFSGYGDVLDGENELIEGLASKAGFDAGADTAHRLAGCIVDGKLSPRELLVISGIGISPRGEQQESSSLSFMGKLMMYAYIAFFAACIISGCAAVILYCLKKRHYHLEELFAIVLVFLFCICGFVCLWAGDAVDIRLRPTIAAVFSLITAGTAASLSAAEMRKKELDFVSAMSDEDGRQGDERMFAQAAVDEVMKKYDRESNTRVWEGWQKWAVSAVLAAFSCFSIYVTLFATWLDLIRYPSFLGSIIIIGYLTFPVRKGTQRVNHMPWYDWVIMLLGTAAFFYVVVNAKSLTIRLSTMNIKTYEIAIGVIGVLALVELCRRSVGLPILCVAGAFFLYALYYYWFGRGLGLGRAVRQITIGLYYQTTGVLTTPVQVCAKFIVVFIIFGAFLERTGISEFFINLANCVAGASSGGPAKVAVISSALCGMVSGSSVGNTVTTGSVTIPMMKKTGYRPEFAGAVEAAASTGGQIMPPIMGAAAFLMAEYVNMPYSSIIVRAILPAVLYFLGIFICVHLEARKLGLKGIPKAELPRFSHLIGKIYLLLPLIVLVYLVSSGSKTMAFAAALSIVVAVVVSMFNKETRMTPVTFLDALAAGAKSCITVAVACGMAGVISGCINLTGLASKLITTIVSVSGGHLIVALFLTMLCCIVLGMGVPTTATYCIMASTCAPILIQMDVPKLAAHFFVFYFGIVADITPPVALAAYAGSAIAKAPPMKTAFNASKLAIAAFVIPYIFALNPSMLLVETTALEVVQVVITSILGILALGVGLEGYLKGRVPWLLRIVALAAGLFLIYPDTISDVVGLAVMAGIFLFQSLLENDGAKAKVMLSKCHAISEIFCGIGSGALLLGIGGYVYSSQKLEDAEYFLKLALEKGENAANTAYKGLQAVRWVGLGFAACSVVLIMTAIAILIVKKRQIKQSQAFQQ